ncbi:MAG: alpha/beta hydrolase [Acidobacteriota bacterium]|nr:alpha/beta hydrolase [Acidobacteriota bacterium]
MLNQTKTILCTLLLSFCFLPAFSTGPGSGDTSITFGTASLSTGVTLQYAERGRGKRNVIIMIPGYLDSWFSYSEVLNNLPASFHAIALTQRGHGDSEKPLEGYAMTDFSEDVVAFMDHFGYRKAHIVGHSMGGAIAQRVAIDHPERVKKLVLIATTAQAVGNEVLLFVADAVADLEDPIDREFVFEFQSGTAPDPISDEFIENIVTESQKVPARVWRDALDGLLQADYSDELSLIEAPTLILWGDRDDIFLFDDQQFLAENIPKARLQIYPNLNHSIQWQRPRLVALEIAAFLREKRGHFHRH